MGRRQGPVGHCGASKKEPAPTGAIDRRQGNAETRFVRVGFRVHLPGRLAVARRPPVGVGLLYGTGDCRGPPGAGRADLPRAPAAFRPGLVARRAPLDLVHERPQSASPRAGRHAGGACRPVCADGRAYQRHGGGCPGPRLRGQFRLRPDGRRARRHGDSQISIRKVPTSTASRLLKYLPLIPPRNRMPMAIATITMKAPKSGSSSSSMPTPASAKAIGRKPRANACMCSCLRTV
ncbi:hypothetical protein G6F22_017920 [Rhizopus arrhizus]|nr:hypothetical protein G6F22_017920 [Rhizopus arrhizus]